MKKCSKCQVEQDESSFSPHPHTSDGLVSWCKACKNSHSRSVGDDRKGRVRAYDPDARRKYNLKQKYGITPEEYEEMLEEQDGKCAICGRTPEDARSRFGKLVVDHDHQTDDVRGLLCTSCNSAIGLLQDEPDVIMAAAAYLLARAPQALKGGSR